MTLQFVQTRDASIGFMVEGPEDGPPLLLLMGLGGSAQEWGEQFLAELRPHRRIIRVDNRGIGNSTHRGDAFSMVDMADDARAVLDALALDCADVLGFSMGGMIAQQLAIDSPGRVGKLVLVSTHAGGDDVVPLQPRAQVLFEPMRPGARPGEHLERLFVQLTAPGFGEQSLSSIRGFVAARQANPVSMDIYTQQMRSLLASDRRAGVATIEHPTLVAHGVEDPLIPVENGRMLAARMVNAQLVELASCGHLPTWECGPYLASRVLQFTEPSP